MLVTRDRYGRAAGSLGEADGAASGIDAHVRKRILAGREHDPRVRNHIHAMSLLPCACDPAWPQTAAATLEEQAEAPAARKRLRSPRLCFSGSNTINLNMAARSTPPPGHSARKQPANDARDQLHPARRTRIRLIGVRLTSLTPSEPFPESGRLVSALSGSLGARNMQPSQAALQSAERTAAPIKTHSRFFTIRMRCAVPPNAPVCDV